ncbi:MAG TPA: NAD(P)/FAD-dependent oxidoreductase [Nitrososphaeraceae archaeon]|nr:NAD(P)/FAD-dependent oxidoreductase [Nitrososphaeraceae archaeon]
METLKIEQNKEGKNNIIDDKRIRDSNNNNNMDISQDEIFDVAIIGGGFAGLSAALLLGRYLRSTIIFDVGIHRKSYIHGYLGYEKTSSAELIQKAWKDVLQYKSVKVVKEKVIGIERDHNNDLFLINTEGNDNKKKKEGKMINQESTDKENMKAKAKYVIIATGVEHTKPNIKNFEEYYGDGIWHCPHCDGFETTDKKLVIIAHGNKYKEALDYAKVFLGWTKDIKLFLKREVDNYNNELDYHLTDDEINEAKTLGIDLVENDEIIEIVGGSPRNSIKSVICESNKCYDAEVLFYHLNQTVRNQLAYQLGCELDERYIKVNENQETSIKNVYAAGDADTDRHYAILASASGALAAISIYEKLLKGAIKSIKINNDQNNQRK